MSETYVVGYDGTKAAQRAVKFAAARAKASGAKIHLVYVLEWSPYAFLTPQELDERHKRREEELSRAEATLKPVADDLKTKGIDTVCEARHGHAGELLCEIAGKLKAQQIVIGRTGSSTITARLMGSLVLSLVQASPVPVTVVP